MDIIRKKVNSVLLPIELIQQQYCGKLYGIYHNETGVFNVLHNSFLTNSKDKRVECLGKITKKSSKPTVGNDLLCGVWKQDKLEFYFENEIIEYKTYSIESDITSRNKGIVDNVHLKDSYAVIVGCGSVGAFVALELAKSGVGKFVLIDNDIFAYHNISRHQCGVLDVGKRKIDALQERIFQINPQAEIKTYFDVIEEVFVDELKELLSTKNAVIVNCGDNRSSSYYSNSLAIQFDSYFVSASAVNKASYGELFWYIPNQKLPCYGCFYGNDFNKTHNGETIRHWYANEVELAQADFIPALSIDIDYISLIASKFALELLMLKHKGYTPRYIQHFTQLMFLVNWLDDKNTPFDISDPLELVKTTVTKKSDCIVCQQKQKNKE